MTTLHGLKDAEACADEAGFPLLGTGIFSDVFDPLCSEVRIPGCCKVNMEATSKSMHLLLVYKEAKSRP